MDLDEYMWRNKILKKTFSKKLKMTSHAFAKIVYKKTSPRLVTAINIIYMTNGEVTMRDLLKPEDVEKLLELKEAKKERKLPILTFS